MSLSREDMLRELELLPAWKLNQPLAVTASPVIENAVHENVLPTQKFAEAAVEAVIEQTVETPINAASDIATMDWATLNQHVIGSGDQNADWLFVGDVATEGDAEILLDKMLIAIQLQRGKNVYLTQLAGIEDFGPEYFKRQIELIQPKLIFVFGEKAAQTLLNSQDVLDALRGKLHQYENVPLIVSYAPSHLLTNTQDKAKAWADLCLARDTLQSMK